MREEWGSPVGPSRGVQLPVKGEADPPPASWPQPRGLCYVLTQPRLGLHDLGGHALSMGLRARREGAPATGSGLG